MLRRALAGCLALAAAGLVTAAGSAAHADIKAPNARAGAIVDSYGAVIDGKNVIRSWRPSEGSYCVQIAPPIDTRDALILLTSRTEGRVPSIAYRFPSQQCDNHPNTVAVRVLSTAGKSANGGFDLLIP
ncbi:hypothetical protein ACBR40_09530 [Nonomuraea sp. AD125B]|uniref:hypothetical protein n=1 Tax=Nonomuraea TaxID=83681 RepID=UPI0031DED4C8